MIQESSCYPDHHLSSCEISLIDENIDDVSKVIDLVQFQKCKILNLHANKLRHLTSFPKLSSLIEINLSSNLIESCDLPELAHLINLEILDLSANMITSTKDFPFLPGLKSLSLAFNHITVLEDLSLSTPQLEVLNCQGNKLQSLEEVLSICVSFSKLGSLNFAGNPCIQSNFLATEAIFKRFPNLIMLNDRSLPAWHQCEDEYAANEAASLEAFYSTIDKRNESQLITSDELSTEDKVTAIISTPKVDDALHRFRDRQQNSSSDNSFVPLNTVPHLHNKIDAYLRSRSLSSSKGPRKSFRDHATSTSDLSPLAPTVEEQQMNCESTSSVENATVMKSPYSTEVLTRIRRKATLLEATSQIKEFVSLRQLTAVFHTWRTVKRSSMLTRTAQAAVEETERLQREFNEKSGEIVTLSAQIELLVAEEKARTEENNRRVLQFETVNHTLRRELETTQSELDRILALQHELEAQHTASVESLAQSVESQIAEQKLECEQLLREKLLECESRYTTEIHNTCHELEIWKTRVAQMEIAIAEHQACNQSLETEKSALSIELEKARSCEERLQESLATLSATHVSVGNELKDAKQIANQLHDELLQTQQENLTLITANSKLQRSVLSSKKRSKHLEVNLQQLSVLALRQKHKHKATRAAQKALVSQVDEKSCCNERLSSHLEQLQSQSTETIDVLNRIGKKQTAKIDELETLLRVKEKMLDDQNVLLLDLKSRVAALEEQKRRLIDDAREMEGLLEEQKNDIFLLEEQLQQRDVIESKLNTVVSELQAQLSSVEINRSVVIAGSADGEHSADLSHERKSNNTTAIPPASTDSSAQVSDLHDKIASLKVELESSQNIVDDLTRQVSLAAETSQQRVNDEQLLRNQFVSTLYILCNLLCMDCNVEFRLVFCRRIALQSSRILVCCIMRERYA